MYRYWEIIVKPILWMIYPKDIVEIGSESGKNTENLLGYCRENNARLHSIDPVPAFDVEKFEGKNGAHFNFFRSLSLNALPLIDRFDLVFIDGDHNWYTVYNELKFIERRCKENKQDYPLVFLHDIGWPYARRDLYYNPDTIPEAFRKPYKKKGMMIGIPDLLEKGGLNPDMYNSIYENDFQNGVLTAVEDFLKDTRYDFNFLQIPGLYGFGILIPSTMALKYPELVSFLKQFELEPGLKKHIENIEEDRIEKQTLINKRTRALESLKKQRSEELESLEKMKNDALAKLENKMNDQVEARKLTQSLNKQLEKINRHLKRDIKGLQENRKVLSKHIDMLSSWLEKFDFGIVELFKSKRWKMANRIGEVARRVRFMPRVPTVENFLNEGLQNYKNWEKKNPLINKIEKKNPLQETPAPGITRLEPKNSIIFSGPPKKLPSVDIVVCVHNALQDVRQCLESVIRNATIEFNLIIVNDGSGKETGDFLEDFQNKNTVCRLITNIDPHGYTVAANQGLKASMADYVILLNSDTIVPGYWIERLIECGETDPAIGIIGPFSNAASWQSLPALWNEKGDWAVNQLPQGLDVEGMAKIVARCSQKKYPRVPFINGFCFAVKRSVINKIGYLDEQTFPKGYGEENDYCLRASEAGFVLSIADDAYVYHAKSKSYSHERRLVLASKGGKALKKKYPDKSISALTTILKKDPVLGQMRRRIEYYYDHPGDISTLLANSSFKVLFFLPVSGGGGGAHSVVQEAFGMRRLGVKAQVAVRKLHMSDYIRNYSSLLEQDGDLFFPYVGESDLIAHAVNFNVVIGTIFFSTQIIKNIVKANPSVMPAYYVQDYEPLFFDKNSENWKIAYDSYALISGMVLMAKTKWLCDIVFEKHNQRVEKVVPSIDEKVYYPLFNRALNPQFITISAMVRPSSPRRSPGMTLAVLKKIQSEFKDKVEINIFGCTDEDPGFVELDRNFHYNNQGILTREKVADLLRQSDIFIDLSTYQAFGRTGLEAMACGCTVVLPQKGGVHEYAVHNENALIVDTKIKKDCYEALKMLVQDQELRNRLKKTALIKASEYSIHRASISEISMLLHKWQAYECEGQSAPVENGKK